MAFGQNGIHGREKEIWQLFLSLENLLWFFHIGQFVKSINCCNFLPVFVLRCYSQVATISTFISNYSVELLLR